MPEGHWLSHLQIQEDSLIPSDQHDSLAPPQSLLRSHRKQTTHWLLAASSHSTLPSSWRLSQCPSSSQVPSALVILCRKKNMSFHLQPRLSFILCTHSVNSAWFSFTFLHRYPTPLKSSPNLFKLFISSVVLFLLGYTSCFPCRNTLMCIYMFLKTSVWLQV